LLSEFGNAIQCADHVVGDEMHVRIDQPREHSPARVVVHIPRLVQLNDLRLDTDDLFSIEKYGRRFRAEPFTREQACAANGDHTMIIAIASCRAPSAVLMVHVPPDSDGGGSKRCDLAG
jgi:hypothetical protein